MNILRFCWVIVLSLILFPACDDQQREIIPEEEFAEIYGDILYLGELYRAHPFELRMALDSMMEYRNIDSMMVFDAVDRYTKRTYDIAELHVAIIERLETMAREDSARNAPPSKGVDASDSSLTSSVDTVSSTSDDAGRSSDTKRR